MIIQKIKKDNVTFEKLNVGDVFYNPVTNNLYLKVSELGRYNCVNLDSAYITDMCSGTEVIPVTNYKFSYTI